LSTGASRQERSTSRVGVRDQPVGSVRPPVEYDVLDELEEVGVDVLVDDELAGVDDAHVQARADGVEQER